MASSSDRAPREDAQSSLGVGGKGGSVSRSKPPEFSQRYPGFCRLKARRQFRETYARGRRVGSASLTLFGLPNDVGHTRLGITATRKVGGAVVRNRAKRMIRECFRQNRSEFTPAMDIVVNVYRSLPEKEFAEVERELLGCFRRLARRFRG